MSKKRGKSNLMAIGAAGFVVLALGGVTVVELMNSRKEAKEAAALWTVAGPQCPALAAGVAPPPMPKAVEREGVTIRREMGPVSCNTIKEGGTGAPVEVCMLLGPKTTRVTTSKGTFDYAPPAGENVSIYVRDGEPSCVMAINRAVM